MILDDNQKTAVTAWIAQGLKLAEIQNRIFSELGLKLTYMEVRLLVDDLRLVPKDQEPSVPPDKVLAPSAPAPTAPPAPSSATPPVPPAGRGKVSLSVDQLTRPGCLASGQVTFSDGQAGEWYLDQMGRLGLAPKVKGYRPSPEDVQEFQMGLEAQLSRLGM